MKFSRFNFITFTVTVADPAVFTSVAHELAEDDCVIFETTGALPTGLSVDTPYYVVYNGITANTFQVATTPGGEPIVTTGTQSGTHSFIKRNRANLKPLYENNR
jgi:hypothetical protein